MREAHVRRGCCVGEGRQLCSLLAPLSSCCRLALALAAPAPLRRVNCCPMRGMEGRGTRGREGAGEGEREREGERGKKRARASK
eukprot:62441-Rhodomonas_salina.1